MNYGTPCTYLNLFFGSANELNVINKKAYADKLAYTWDDSYVIVLTTVSAAML